MLPALANDMPSIHLYNPITVVIEKIESFIFYSKTYFQFILA